MNNTTGLVLEGGGFRGLFTAGILHAMLQDKIEFPYTVAVSMGASNATNYLAKQTKRNLEIPYTFVNDSRYISYTRMLTKGELFGMDFIFNHIPYTLNPFDFETFANSQQELVFVCTDCNTGKPYYVNKLNSNDSFKALEASTSLPFASKMVKLHNKLLLDGGISDPIPAEKALADGYHKIVVILTQPKAYRKQAVKGKVLIKTIYRKYPHLAEAILNRHHIYNQQLDTIERLEAEGRAFVFRPEHTLPISRTEKNKEKLKEAFDMGYRQYHASREALMHFITD